MGVAWASLGLLAAVSFAFFALTWTQRGEFSAAMASLGSEVHSLGKEVRSLGTELRAAIEAQSAKTDALGVELRAAIERQGTELRAAVATQGDKIDSFGVELRSAISGLSARIEDHSSGHRHTG